MRKLGVVVALGIALGSMAVAAPVAAADDHRHRRDQNRYDRHDYSRHDRYGQYRYGQYRYGQYRYGHDRYRHDRYGHERYGHDRRFTLGVKIVDQYADDRGRRGASRGDRWALEFRLLDYRQRVGHGVADCRVTHAPNRSWRDSKSHCDVLFRLPDGDLRMAGTIDGDDFDDGHATLPIRGGSGEFRGADGKTVFRPTGGWYRHDRGRGRDLVADVHVH